MATKTKQGSKPKQQPLSPRQRALIVGAARILVDAIEDKSRFSRNEERTPLNDARTYEELDEVLDATKLLYQAIESANPENQKPAAA